MTSGIDLPLIGIAVGLAFIALVVIFEIKKTPTQEATIIEREDKAMSDVEDDPREMARWVP